MKERSSNENYEGNRNDSKMKERKRKGSYEKRGDKKWGGKGIRVVWGIDTMDPRMLCFRANRESRDVDVAFLFCRSSEPHGGRGTGGGVAGLTQEAKI